MQDNRIRLKDIKSGQFFYEEDMGMVTMYRAEEDARETNKEHSNGYECRAKPVWAREPEIKTGNTVVFFGAHDDGAYALRLYAAPSHQNVTQPSNS